MNHLIASEVFKTGVMILRPGRTYIFGRGKGCDVFTPTAKASRQHCTLSWSGKIFTIEDNGSKNGTTLNGRTVEGPTVLNDGDVIVIDPCTFVYRKAEAGLTTIMSKFNVEEFNTEIIQKPEGSQITGTFSDGQLFEVLQLLEFHGKSGTLRINAGSDYGKMVFKEGSIVAAKFHADRGERAARALTQIDSGKYDFTEESRPVGDGRTKLTPSRLIFEAARILDESKHPMFDDDMDADGLLDENPNG